MQGALVNILEGIRGHKEISLAPSTSQTTHAGEVLLTWCAGLCITTSLTEQETRSKRLCKGRPTGGYLLFTLIQVGTLGQLTVL